VFRRDLSLDLYRILYAILQKPPTLTLLNVHVEVDSPLPVFDTDIWPELVEVEVKANKATVLLRLRCTRLKRRWCMERCDGSTQSSSLEQVVAVHHQPALDLGAGVEQPFDCLIV